MTTSDHLPPGAPCWADLWTSDVERARTFYGELLGWTSGDPDPSHGGYFMFFRDGVPVAGGMGDMGDMKADDRWKLYLATDDATKAVEAAVAAGAQVFAPPMPVDDLGVQVVLADPAGATVGLWQAGTFPGFPSPSGPGTPAWMELLSTDYDKAVAFYRDALGWDARTMSDTPEFRYTTLHDDAVDNERAGIMDAAHAPGATAGWFVYWWVDDTDASCAQVERLGGRVVNPPMDSPYGRMASVADPMGAEFRLHQPNR